MIRAKTAQKLPFCRVMASATPSTILFVANFPANTGYAWDFIESLFAGLATRLAPAGVRTLVAYPEIVSPPRTLLGTPAQPVLLDAGLETIHSLRTTVSFIRRERVDLLYLIDRPARHVGYPLLRAAGVRSILVHDHTSGAGTVPRGVKRLAKWTLARVPGWTADRIIAVSDFVLRRQIEVGMIPAHRVARVWNSVPVPQVGGGEVSRAARRELGLESNGALIVCTCRATPQKGVDHLLRAFDRLDHRSDGASAPILAYAGDGPAFASLQALRKSLRSRDRIHLLGYRPDRHLLLDAADVCVVPSVWQEAFGLAALEGMARGKPVVATAVGGIPEIIRPGVTGLLVPPGDEARLASAIASLLENRTAAADMGRNARRDVEKRFQPERLLTRLAELVIENLPRSGTTAQKLLPSSAT